ncbi:MAG TPA: DUF2911 domain-containing protein [Blastocatellia bacterium]|nr:DUF2911 domain-containing protein [Blastocatellia bacterium]
MKLRYVIFILVFFAATLIQAQDKKSGIGAAADPMDERGSTRVLYWNRTKDEAAGEFSIDYGRPVWQAAYENTAAFDTATKGKVWRMGSNFWTVLDTNLPIKISGKDVPIGSWYLGLRRANDGSWSLVFIDPAKTRAAHIDGYDINKAAIAFETPVKIEQAEDKKEKLTIELSVKKDNMKDVTLRIYWGNLQLSAPIQVTVES